MKVKKVGTKSESEKAWNYPYAALEEIVANCLYHRDYRQREPIEIQVEPHELRFISYGGPGRSVRLEDFSKGIVNPRRYRNRRIGDFFKELDITEGKSTGVPTIVGAMKENGSPAVKFEFDEERTWFMVTVPVHEWFLEGNDTLNEPVNGTVNDTVNGTVNETEQIILRLIKSNASIKIEDMVLYSKKSRRTVIRALSSLKDKNLIKRIGSDKSGYWQIQN